MAYETQNGTFEAPHEKGTSEWRVFGVYRTKLIARTVQGKPLAPYGRGAQGDVPFNLLILKRLYRAL